VKVVALGGAGGMGSRGVRELAKRAPDVDVVIADKDIDKAGKLAVELGGKVSAVQVDADEAGHLVKVMKGADVVANTIGPYYVYGEKVLRAAIEAKADLVDINDDQDSVQSCLRLHEKARRANITAIICLGATPGITNVLARYGAGKLDEVDDIRILWFWTTVGPSGAGLAITDHVFHATSGEILTYRDGKLVRVPANSEPEIVELIPPVGKGKVAHFGHPEPVTIPHYIKVKNVCNKGGSWPESANEFFEFVSEFGLNSLREITINGTTVPIRTITSKIFGMLPELIPEKYVSWVKEAKEKYGDFGVEGAVLKVEVKGLKQGKRCRYTYFARCPAETLITSLPMVLGTLLLTRGQIRRKGVFAPEGIVDPGVFIEELGKDIFLQEYTAEQ